MPISMKKTKKYKDSRKKSIENTQYICDTCDTRSVIDKIARKAIHRTGSEAQKSRGTATFIRLFAEKKDTIFILSHTI